MKTLVAVAQMTSTEDKQHNLALCMELIQKASHQGAKMLCLPENFLYIGRGDGEALRMAETLDGPSLTALRAQAQKLRICLSLGGFAEQISPAAERFFNSHLIIDEEGEIIATYRKIHLFTATLSDNSRYDEAKSVEAGEVAVVFRGAFFTAGLSICYDVRFPYLYSALRSLGAQVLVVPAAFTQVTGQAHWEILLRARAIETQSYVLAAAQCGRHNEKRTTHGHAMIIDPWGSILAECENTNELAMAELDMAFLETLRTQMPVWSHRRSISS